jgi:hypothetical protein
MRREICRNRAAMRRDEKRLVQALEDVHVHRGTPPDDPNGAAPEAAPTNGGPLPPAVAVLSAAIVVGLCMSPAFAGVVCPPQLTSSGAVVDLLLTTSRISDSQRRLDLASARAVVSCLLPGETVTVRAITADATSEAPVFSDVVPAGPAGFLDVDGTHQQRVFRQRLADAIERTLTSASSESIASDVLGTIAAVAAESPKRKHAIVDIGGGWQQSALLNAFVAGTSPATLLAPALKKLREADLLPQLPGSSIFVLGIEGGDRRMGMTSRVRIVCSFWRSVATEESMRLAICAPTLEGVSV